MDYAFSLYRIRNTFFQSPSITKDLVEAFRMKFDPMNPQLRTDGTFENLCKKLAYEISDLGEEIDRSVFQECLQFMKYCQKMEQVLQSAQQESQTHVLPICRRHGARSDADL